MAWHTLKVNKSGKSVPMIDQEGGNDFQTPVRVGTMYARESYTYVGNNGDHDYIFLLTSNGEVKTITLIEDLPEGFMTDCTDYPYGKVTIGGKQYYTFIMRETKNVYYGDFAKWGTVAAGRRVATTNADVGREFEHMDWKQINYVENTSGQWVAVTGHGDNFGFVDTGLSKRSRWNNIAMYGSW